MSDKIELLPCLCGSNNHHVHYESPQCYWVWCGECNFETAKVMHKEDAIAMWNNRSALDQQAAELERCKAGQAVPDGLSLERIERHAQPAGGCPSSAKVVLLSSIKRLLSAAPAAPAQVAQEPVAWEFRTFHGDDTVTPGWSKWERIESHGRYSHETVESRVAEIQSYIDRGYRYELRALYAAPPAAEQPDSVKVPRELLDSAATWLEVHAPGGGCIEGSVASELRALLGGGEA